MQVMVPQIQMYRDNTTTEFKTMCRTVEALFHWFPDIRCDIAQVNQDTQPLISKIRKVMKGAHTAHNANANVIQWDIFILSHDDTKKHSWSMPAMIEKTSCGIKSEFMLSLSGTWPAILYNEAMVEADNELIGSFRSEMLLQCRITILYSPSAGHGWKYPESFLPFMTASVSVNKDGMGKQNIGVLEQYLIRIFFGEREEEEELKHQDHPLLTTQTTKIKLLQINPRVVLILADQFHNQKSEEEDCHDLEGYETGTPIIYQYPTTCLLPKKKQRRYSTEQESPPATPQPTICAKRKQAVKASSSQLQHHAMHSTWRDICGDLKRSIRHATVAGYKEAGAEFTRIVSMGAEEGTHYFNENYECIEWLKNDVKKKYKNISAAGPVPQENQGSGATSKPPTQKKKGLMLKVPAPKNKAPQRTCKATEVTQNSSEAMPLPRATCSTMAQLSHQSTQEEEPDPLTNEEPTMPPAKSISTRKKLSVITFFVPITFPTNIK
ncbi:hypothetical protein BDM02DRAFT_3229397 [Thelephora ganbajun]|uniref:Uncharacterized protein n=1 Tax=Thelephora ganbajun TaxID=370292 RepID=A0ACB6ZJ20_THEGA|nr:hypothetical protein BDM02DRAFT_3229397 [Thelephora ganbajun]